MKRLLIVLALLAFAFPAQAEEKEATCEDWARLAGTIMETRQKGADMAGLMSIVKGKGRMEDIAFEAYSIQRFDLAEDKKRAVEDFRNEIYRRCYRDTGGK